MTLRAASLQSAPIDPAPRILFLCTGNLCRSPMAAALMRRRAEMAGSNLDIGSAGFQVNGGPPPPETTRVMQRRGIDLSSHRSRVVTAEALLGADLVVGMTRAHIWDAALLQPEVLPRAFVFGELVRLNQLSRHRRAGEPFATWVEQLHDARQHGLTRIVPGDEVPDPYGRRLRAHERVVRRLERLVLESGDCAFDPALPDAETRWREGKLIWHP